MTSTDNMSNPPPQSATRQIGEQHWMAAANILKSEQINCAIVSFHFTGWVYLIEKTRQDNIFRCMTYKIAGDPCKIKKDLYNYTVNNGHLIDALFYNSSVYGFN